MLVRILAGLLLLLPAAISAQAVTEQQLRRHIEILASDSFEGRAPGTAGEKKTTDYIAAQWQALGLEPAGEGGSWLQPVPLATRTPLTQTASFSGRRGSIGLDQAHLMLLGRSADERIARAPVVFAGYGTGPGEMDLEGAVVFLLHGEAPGQPPYRERAKAMARLGAAAVLAVFEGPATWRQLQRYYEGGVTRIEDGGMAPVEGTVSRDAAAILFGRAGLSFEKLERAARDGSFRPRRLKLDASITAATDVRLLATNNVVGRLKGSGGSRESVLLLGHWDHLGICRGEGVADRICNGAVDNASGIAALIEIARALASGPRPSRDILFLATTAEEMGLLGAARFAARPPVPLDTIVAAVNLDTIAIAPRGEKVAVIGRGMAALDSLIEETAIEKGRVLDTDGEADSFVQRQDGWALAQAGVPAVMVGGSFSDMAKLQSFLGGAYHKPSDNPSAELVLGGAAEDSELLIALARKLADPRRLSGRPSLARP